MILDFLKTKRPKAELKVALEILREFKTAHTLEEDFICSLAGWVKLEQLEEYLAHLVENKPLEEDTLEYMDYKLRGQE